MCGITGQFFSSVRPEQALRFAAATDALRHRGPDDEGFVWLPVGGSASPWGGSETPAELRLPDIREAAGQFQGRGLLLGHRRLSILDLSVAGHQPMQTDGGKLWVVFNGEVYNYRELRAELASTGRFHTESDTEVVLRAYQTWGKSAFRRFIGMFAIAIADFRNPESPELVLARDPLGIKPLYHANLGGGMAFASEIKALLALGASRMACPERLQDYLAGGFTDHGSRTFFAEIFQLPPGHLLTVSLSGRQQGVTSEAFWTMPQGEERKITFQDAAAELRERFLDSIRLHLRSDVPVGAALSGGIDSSAIVCAMREVAPSADLRTFSYVADDPQLSEERWVDVVIQKARTAKFRTQPMPEDLVRSLDGLVATQDEPFDSTSIFAQSSVFKLARENGIKVMLDGQGADELFAGYGGFAIRRTQELLARRQFGAAAKFIFGAKHAVGGHGLWMIRSILQAQLPASWRQKLQRVGRYADAQKALRSDWFRSHGVEPFLPPVYRGRTAVGDQLREMVTDFSLPKLLRYEDRNSMAHSVESRVPFLTVPFVEFALSLPSAFAISGDGTSKSVLRVALRSLVPDEILERRDKVGFAAPEARWLKSLRPWIEAKLNSPAAQSIPVLHWATVTEQWNKLFAGEVAFDPRFWRWLNLIAWVEGHSVTFPA